MFIAVLITWTGAANASCGRELLMLVSDVSCGRELLVLVADVSSGRELRT